MTSNVATGCHKDSHFPELQETDHVVSVVATSADVIPVVILNWNGEKDTIECLQSIRQSVPAGFVPVLVDNGSRPGSVELLKDECKRLFKNALFLKEDELASLVDRFQREELQNYLTDDSMVLIENSDNMGFAKGNNIGTKFAEVIGAEWVMLLNNDTVVSTDTFLQLRQFRDAHPSFVAITPQIRQYSTRNRILNCGGDLKYFGRLKYKFEGEDPSAIEQSGLSVITFITGCALLFKYKTTGLLTEDFFFGEEDYEFSLRMKQRGLSMACFHGSIIYHKLGTTISRSSKRLGQIILYYVNRLINTRAYYSSFRWQATRILGYMYLPLLLAKSGVDPRRSVSAIRRIQTYISCNRGVTRTQFQELIGTSR